MEVPIRDNELSQKLPTQRDKRSLDERRLTQFPNAGLFSDNTFDIEYRRAVTISDLQAAYRLVHDVFVDCGYIVANKSGMRIREYEKRPVTATYVAKSGNSVLGVLSLITDSEEWGLPSDHVFPEEISALRASGYRICEISNQAIAHTSRRTRICTELMRCVFAHAWTLGCDYMIGSISPDKRSFFELISFKQIGEARNYSHELEDTVIEIGLDIHELRSRWRTVDVRDNTREASRKRYFLIENPFLDYVPAWNKQVLDTFPGVSFTLAGWSQRNLGYPSAQVVNDDRQNAKRSNHFSWRKAPLRLRIGQRDSTRKIAANDIPIAFYQPQYM